MTVELILGDCLEVMKGMQDKSVDAIITDPPYPDCYVDEYQYRDGLIDFLNDYKCRQLVFWSAKVDFPLDYSAIHIWDKMVGCGSEYERIFERNGNANYKIFRDYFINSTVAAQMTNDEYTGHKSQKPLRLVKKLLLEFTNEGDNILDPFMGSGTTGVACVQTGRKFIGIEINPEYFAIAERRIKEAQMQPRLL
jgi:site-specific DNA-methyltransferase (adenine-specific)